jgi:arabinoxylan arabinofuranohydrolase
VAVSDSPTGPFVDARGSALVTNDMTLADADRVGRHRPRRVHRRRRPGLSVLGQHGDEVRQTEANMTEFDGPIHTVGMDRFTEAPYLHKHKGTYYLSYSRHFPEETAYMTGPTPPARGPTAA